jgi:hypothetical protein
MRRNPKPSAIGTDFWFGPDLIDSISVNGSVRVIPSDGQTNPVNHRDLKAFIPKNLSDAEERKLESSKDLELLELRDLDAEAEIESKDPEISSIPQKVALATDFLECSLNPIFLLQAKYCLGDPILSLHGNGQ